MRAVISREPISSPTSAVRPTNGSSCPIFVHSQASRYIQTSCGIIGELLAHGFQAQVVVPDPARR